jgi:hypothetical protein
LRGWDFTSEDEVNLRVWLLTQEKMEKPTSTILQVLDEREWEAMTSTLGVGFGLDTFQLSEVPAAPSGPFDKSRFLPGSEKCAIAFVAPRGVGPTRWSEASPFDGKPAGHHIRRRFALLGQTLDGQRVWDVRRALAALRAVPELHKGPFWLQGKNDASGIALYAALFEPDVVGLRLWDLPATHAEGPVFLNVLRVLDLPQAVALALPRKVEIAAKDEAEERAWAWALELQQALGLDRIQVRPIKE